MKKLFTLLIFLIFISAGQGTSQTVLDRYQYWFNGNQPDAVTEVLDTPGQDLDISISVPAGELPVGLHSFHVRFRDDQGRWSSTVSRFFYKMPVSGVVANSITGYQYWFNNDSDDAAEVTSSVTGLIELDEALDVAGMADGLHSLHIRFRDEEGRWSSTVSRFFYKMPVSGVVANSITSYQYWFNNDSDDAVEVSSSGTGLIELDEALDVAGMADGLHSFHLRFRDEHGRWSSTVSRFFYKMPVSESADNKVTAYRYWFNDDDGAIIRTDLAQPVNPLDLVTEIETPYLEPGMHSLHIQFLDLNNHWSVVLTEEFETEDCMPRYIGIPEGTVHVCHGTSEEYSVGAAMNVTGFTWALEPEEAGTITPGGATVQVIWSDSFSGAAELSVTGYNPCGETGVRSVTVDVEANPYVIPMEDTSVCLGEAIELTVLDSHGTLEWDVADLVVSPSEETSYTVTASNFCGADHGTIVIGVDTPPSLTVMDDVSICEGESVELTAETDGYLDWSGGSVKVTPEITTVYTATATNGVCTVQDEVTVTVDPVPETPVLTQEGDILISSALSGNTWYLNDAIIADAEGQQYSPATSGSYYVIVTSDKGCVSDKSNTIQFILSNSIRPGMDDITVFPNPADNMLYVIPGMNSEERFRVELITTGGRVLIMREISGEAHIDVSAIPPSVYILRISRGDESKVLRIVKN